VAVATQLELAGDDLNALLSVRRSQPRLQLALGDKWGQKAELASLVGTMQKSLREIHQLDASMAISGTLAKPQFTLQSPIGSQLRHVLHAALQAEVHSQGTALQAQARTALELEVANIEQQLAVYKQSVFKKLNVADEQQKQLESLIAKSFSMPKERLGRELLRALNRR
jgi:hypothetical protein